MPAALDHYPTGTYERLHELLVYNRRSGMLTWRVDRGRLAKAGDEAGCIRNPNDPEDKQQIIVTIDGKPWLAHRLVWFMVTAEPGPRRITFRDGNHTNLKFSNLAPHDDVYAPSPMALYQRQLRRRHAGDY